MEQEVRKLKQVSDALLAWYDRNRRVLPWREEVSAYRTWVSEVMLQQTRVAAVIPYFERFMAAYPTAEALARADSEQVLKLWEGLGYYSRARNLQKAAKIITEEYGGQFPAAYEKILALPGIGEYTAGAIASIAFGLRVPAVDGNVLRVTARIIGSRLDVLDTKNRKLFRSWVAEAMPQERPGAYNQALMDLGATICLPNGDPQCESCPVREACAARAAQCQRELPVRREKRDRRTEQRTVFILSQDGKVALRQRPETGLLALLWEYPHVAGRLNEKDAAAQAADWGLTIRRWDKKLTASHIFTHIRWEMTGYILEVRGEGPVGWLWADEEERKRRAIPAAFDRFTEEIDC